MDLQTRYDLLVKFATQHGIYIDKCHILTCDAFSFSAGRDIYVEYHNCRVLTRCNYMKACRWVRNGSFTCDKHLPDGFTKIDGKWACPRCKDRVLEMNAAPPLPKCIQESSVDCLMDDGFSRRNAIELLEKYDGNMSCYYISQMTDLYPDFQKIRDATGCSREEAIKHYVSGNDGDVDRAISDILDLLRKV